jgi:uncharacterized protein YjbI with pentapeptide repeats
MNFQNRSFRGQDLTDANFCNADVRGCDFSNAHLVGANFLGAKLGLSWRQKLLSGIWIAIALIMMGDSVSRMVANAISQSPIDAKAPYVLILLVILSATGMSTALIRFRNGLLIITATLCGALLGFAAIFFHSGLADKVKWSPLGAIAGAVLLFLLSYFRRRAWFKIMVKIAGAIASYGATFFWGTIAGSFLSVQEWLPGILFVLVTVAFLGLTTFSLFCAIGECRTLVGTSFRRADLRNAKFDAKKFPNTDFCDTIGANLS